jgi:hypothetical protein
MYCASLRHRGSATSVELVINGEVAAEDRTTFTAFTRDEGAVWVAGRCTGGGVFAHTSPMFVGSPARKPEAAAPLLKLVEQTREWAVQHGRYENPKRREQLLARCDEAAAKLGAAP